MHRRWKIALALVVLGMGGFFVAALLSPATPPLTIRFVGYVTNSAFRLDETLPPKDGSVLATFAITNHTARAMGVNANSEFRFPAGITRQAVHWMASNQLDLSIGESFPLFKPGEGALAGVRVYGTNQPVSVIAAGWHARRSRTALGRFLAEMPWNRRSFFVKATSEPR